MKLDTDLMLEIQKDGEERHLITFAKQIVINKEKIIYREKEPFEQELKENVDEFKIGDPRIRVQIITKLDEAISLELCDKKTKKRFGIFFIPNNLSFEFMPLVSSDIIFKTQRIDKSPEIFAIGNLNEVKYKITVTKA